MVCGIVGKPGSARKLEKSLHADYGGIPVYHFLKPSSLEVDVMQNRPCDDVALRFFRHNFPPVCGHNEGFILIRV
jgi:hypothetical protein